MQLPHAHGEMIHGEAGVIQRQVCAGISIIRQRVQALLLQIATGRTIAEAAAHASLLAIQRHQTAPVLVILVLYVSGRQNQGGVKKPQIKYVTILQITIIKEIA